MPHPLLAFPNLNQFRSESVFMFFKNSILGNCAPKSRDFGAKLQLKRKFLNRSNKLPNFKILVLVIWKLQAVKLITKLERVKKKNLPLSINFCGTILKCFVLLTAKLAKLLSKISPKSFPSFKFPAQVVWKILTNN